MPRRSAASQAAAALGRRGGKARAKALTPEERRASARRAVTARWAAHRARKARDAP